jgi:hypothetical protein
MPVEIRELHIKVKVNERDTPGQRLDTQQARNQERSASEEALVAECVEQTLQVLKEKQER